MSQIPAFSHELLDTTIEIDNKDIIIIIIIIINNVILKVIILN